MPYTDRERSLLARYFSTVDAPDHGDIFLVRNLPPEVAATLNGVYSRSPKSMRDNFLDRLKKGLAEQGKELNDLPAPDPQMEALDGVMSDKSGKFLKTYAIDHGHNSLREGSVLHLGVEKVSQLVTRFIQRERRCSFEESSTRYISFQAENHWRDPDVVAAGGAALAAYDGVLEQTFALYQELSEALVAYLKEQRPLGDGEKEGPYLRTIKAEAFDAARYLLTPAIQTKWGMVIDARTLSDVCTELMSHPLAEFRMVGERLKQEAEKDLHTLLSHAGNNEYLRSQHDDFPALARRLAGSLPPPAPAKPRTELLDWDRDLDAKLLASLLYEHSDRSLPALTDQARQMTPEQREQLLDEAMARRGKRDPMPIGLEGAQPFDFEVLVDFGAYRDIGRHRKGFQQQQLLTTAHGFVVPPLVDRAGHGARYRQVLEQAAEQQRVVAERFPHAAGYVTPFAFLQRVRILFDPRQVDYFVELRSGPEGHFAYRQVALDMFAAVRTVSPLFARFIRAQEGEAFLGRMQAEQGADERRKQRMIRAGDLPAQDCTS